MTAKYAASTLLLITMLTLNLKAQNDSPKRLTPAGANAILKPRNVDVPSSDVLRFEGTVALPSKTSTFSVMDYLTIYDSTLYVAGMSTGTLGIVRLDDLQRSNGKINARGTDIPGLKGAHGFAVVPELQLGFATAGQDNIVAVVDLQKRAIVDRIKVAAGPDAILYDAASGLVYVGNADAKLATLIDPKTRTIVATIPLGGSTEFAVVDPRSGLLYQNLEDTSEVVVVDLHKRAVVERWPLGACTKPTGLAIDGGSRRLFVGCSGNATLSVISMSTHHSVANLPIGKWPDSVAYDESLHRIYTTGLTGKLVVIEQKTADRYGTLKEINTHFGAHTLTVDPATHRVYLACVGVFAGPKVAVYSVP